MNALFIVTSPLQLLCAVEAYNYYKIKRADLIVKLGGNPTSNEMLKQLLKNYNCWENIQTISKKKSLRDLIKVVHQIPSNTYTYMFNAEYNGWFQNVIIANTNYQNRVIYDDGTMTINDYRVYFTPREASKKKHPEKELLLRLAGINKFRPKVFDKLELFTMFQLDTLPHVSIIENRFSASSSYRKNVTSVRGAPLGLLGQPLVEAGIVAKEYYLQCLRTLSQERPILYFPHRAESSDLIKIWENACDIRVIRDELPIELAIANHSVSYLAGFFSTALKTLSLLYPQLDIQFIKTPDNEFSSEKFRINANNIYKQFVGERMSELKLDD